MNALKARALTHRPVIRTIRGQTNRNISLLGRPKCIFVRANFVRN